MKYACLIYGVERELNEQEGQENMQAHWAFSEQMNERGHMRGGEALHPSHTATCVRVNAAGETITSDGPFAETKEQLGGFYILECENLDEAIACAALIPEAKGGVVEVRPLMVFD